MIILALNDFMTKYNLKNTSTNNVKISDVINQLKIKDFNIYIENERLRTKQGIVNLSKKGTHWVCYYNNFYFDSYGVKPPKNIERQLKQHSIQPLIYSTFKIQRNDNKCASYCLYFLYLVNIVHMKEQAAVLLIFLSLK
jgi:hypothetical protein